MFPSLPEVFIPSSERNRLNATAERARFKGHPVAGFLQSELRRAQFCSAPPPATVVMNGWVNFHVDWSSPAQSRKLVYPDEYAGEDDKLSLLSPLGAALLGLRAGDRMPFLTLDRSFRLVSVVDADAPLRMPFPLDAHTPSSGGDTADSFDPGPQAA